MSRPLSADPTAGVPGATRCPSSRTTATPGGRLLAAFVMPVLAALPAVGSAQSLDDARSALAEGRYEDALGAYEELAGGGAPAEVRAAYARALMEVGRYEDAVEAADGGAADGGSALANVRGEALYALGRIEAAEAAFRAAADGEAPDRHVARKNLAVLLWNRGARDEALRIFDSFIDLYNGAARLSADELMAVGTAVRYLGLRDHVLFQDALLAFDQAAAAAPRDPRPKVLVGRLFLEKYNSPEAHTSFGEVLARNPAHPDALLGEARALEFDGRGGAMEVVRRALETNANHVEARAFLAELHLKTEDHGQALEEVRRALDVNPNHLGALTVLAAAHYLAGDTAGFRRARDRVLELDPVHAGLYATVAELAADQRKYHTAVELAGRAVELDSASWSGLAVLGMNQLRIGAIEVGRASLERSFGGDPYNVWVKNALDLLDTFDRYETVRTGHFELFLHGDEAELLGVYASALAEEAFDALAARYGVEPPTPVRVELFPSHADFSVRALGEAGLGALGVAFGSVLVMDSPAAREPGQFNWASTFWHELAHAFHLGMTDHRVPRWFSEGLAVHEQRTARPRWGPQVSVGWLQAWRAGRLHPVSRLNEGFVRPDYPEQVIFSYYQASLVFEMIEERWGFDAVLRMLRGYRDGGTTERLVDEVLGLSLEELDEAFADYVEGRFGARIRAVEPVMEGPTMGAPSLEELQRQARRHPGSFQARHALGKALFDQGRPEEAEEELRAALRLFPEYGAPDSPYRYLARIHRERGEAARAAEALHALGARNEGLLEVHVEEAELRRELGQPEAEARALENAVEVFPYDVESHVRLAELYGQLGEHAGAVRERRAVLALDPVDRADAHFRLAHALHTAGRSDEARRPLLRALEIAPNFQAALDLLLELRGGAP